eukprot:UN33975
MYSGDLIMKKRQENVSYEVTFFITNNEIEKIEYIHRKLLDQYKEPYAPKNRKDTENKCVNTINEIRNQYDIQMKLLLQHLKYYTTVPSYLIEELKAKIQAIRKFFNVPDKQFLPSSLRIFPKKVYKGSITFNDKITTHVVPAVDMCRMGYAPPFSVGDTGTILCGENHICNRTTPSKPGGLFSAMKEDDILCDVCRKKIAYIPKSPKHTKNLEQFYYSCQICQYDICAECTQQTPTTKKDGYIEKMRKRKILGQDCGLFLIISMVCLPVIKILQRKRNSKILILIKSVSWVHWPVWIP